MSIFRKVLIISSVSYVISFCFSMFFAGAKTFDEMSYDESAQSLKNMLIKQIEEDNEYVAKLQLGRLYFEHNQLEAADEMLLELIEEDPEHMEALAWYGANQCKIIGESQPWLMGIKKLSRAKACLERVKTALDSSPDDFTIQLIAITTGSVVNVGDSLEWATQQRQSMEAVIESQPNYFPVEVVDYFNLAASENDIALGKTVEAKQRLETIVTNGQHAFVKRLAKEKLQTL